MQALIVRPDVLSCVILIAIVCRSSNRLSTPGVKWSWRAARSANSICTMPTSSVSWSYAFRPSSISGVSASPSAPPRCPGWYVGYLLLACFLPSSSFFSYLLHIVSSSFQIGVTVIFRSLLPYNLGCRRRRLRRSRDTATRCALTRSETHLSSSSNKVC